MAIKVSGTTVINDSRALENITDIPNIVRSLTMSVPANGSTDTGVGKDMTLTAGPYEAVFGVSDAVQFQIDNNSDFSSPVYDAVTETGGATAIINAVDESIPTSTTLYIRARYRDTAGQFSQWSSTNSFTSRSSFAFVANPTITDPTAGESFTPSQDVFNSSAFTVTGGSGYAHTSTSWQVASDIGFTNVITQLIENTSNKTSWDGNGGTGTLGVQQSYYVRVKYHQATLGETDWSSPVLFTVPEPRGESIYSTEGTFFWTAPTGVNSVSVVTVGGGGCGYNGGDVPGGGGGGCGWKNNISVTPGQGYQVTVGRGATSNSSSATLSSFVNTGTVYGGAGTTSNSHPGNNSYTAFPGGQFNGDGGGNGGDAGSWSGTQGGGGGAGGYIGQGGRGGHQWGYTQAYPASAGTGGGGGGGWGATHNTTCGGGGGVGLLGQGPDGAAGAFSNDNDNGGKGGSGGGNGGNSQAGSTGQPGGSYGGGASGSRNSTWNGPGGHGAVRIVWPGNTRQFPTSDVGAS